MRGNYQRKKWNKKLNNFIQKIPGLNIDQEIKELKKAARKVIATKNSARHFLVSIGMYLPNGKIKPQYR